MSFALYGLIRKPQPPLAGLMREMIVLLPASLLGLLWLATARERSPLIDASADMHGYLSPIGLVTAGLLLLFHAATRRLPLVAVGMFQCIAPTMKLLLATVVSCESFDVSHAMGFGLVWIGLALFSFESVRRARIQRNVLRTAHTTRQAIGSPDR